MITVVGANGYIGSALVKRLREIDIEHAAIGRDITDIYGRALGTVVYCAGVTTDFARRPFDTVEAHVAQLCDIFQRANFERFVYLSSTRVYMDGQATDEDSPVSVQPSNPDYLYNLSKLLGENLCRYAPGHASVVRLSNVYGFDHTAANFLPIIIRQAITRGEIHFESALESAKDYISLPSAIDLLIAIAKRGRPRIYNLAAGNNISHREIAEVIARETNCTVTVADNAKAVIFPRIVIARLKAEIGEPQTDLLADIPRLVKAYRVLG